MVSECGWSRQSHKAIVTVGPLRLQIPVWIYFSQGASHVIHPTVHWDLSAMKAVLIWSGKASQSTAETLRHLGKTAQWTLVKEKKHGNRGKI